MPRPKKSNSHSVSSTRRQFLLSSSAIAVGSALWGYEHFVGGLLKSKAPINLYLPGMAQGHLLRQNTPMPQPNASRQTKVAIIGSGAAGLFAAWRLLQAGVKDIVLIEGPEFCGNASSGAFKTTTQTFNYPRGAHYLPLPSMESVHVRELLFDMGVILQNPYAVAPSFAETVLVNAPSERVWVNDAWQEGLVPKLSDNDIESNEHKRFFDYIEKLKTTVGNDGRRAFAVPTALSTRDYQWRDLDQLSFDQWLDQENYHDKGLRWYLDYVCRDDYGIGSAQTSAWAGLHYFASRSGAANIQGQNVQGEMLTWPDGLNPLMQHMVKTLPAHQRVLGMATHIDDQGTHVQVDVVHEQTVTRIHANYVICAAPLHVAARIFPKLSDFGFDPTQHMPSLAAWQVSNFLLKHAPVEAVNHTAMAWENNVYPSKSLGFVNAQNQLLQRNENAPCVLTTYHAYVNETPHQIRERMLRQNTDELFEIAAQDLNTVYGKHWQNLLENVEITLRGHAMASPTVGFLSNSGLAALRDLNGNVLFAHSDLSGMSIFEEATWWGEVCARKIIDKIQQSR